MALSLAQLRRISVGWRIAGLTTATRIFTPIYISVVSISTSCWVACDQCHHFPALRVGQLACRRLKGSVNQASTCCIDYVRIRRPTRNSSEFRTCRGF